MVRSGAGEALIIKGRVILLIDYLIVTVFLKQLKESGSIILRLI